MISTNISTWLVWICAAVWPATASGTQEAPGENSGNVKSVGDGDVEAASLTLSTIFLGEKEVEGAYEEVVVREGTVLNSGDGLKIVFETNRDAYVYVLLFDSLGKAGVVFPHEQIETANHVRGGLKVEVPPGDRWFFLDKNTGTETIYVLASVHGMPDIEKLVARIEAMGPGRDNTSADREIAGFATRGADKAKRNSGNKPKSSAGVVRGIAVVRKGSLSSVKLSDGKVVKKAYDMLTGTGAVVRAVSFTHR